MQGGATLHSGWLGVSWPKLRALPGVVQFAPTLFLARLCWDESRADETRERGTLCKRVSRKCVTAEVCLAAPLEAPRDTRQGPLRVSTQWRTNSTVFVSHGWIGCRLLAAPPGPAALHLLPFQPDVKEAGDRHTVCQITARPTTTTYRTVHGTRRAALHGLCGDANGNGMGAKKQRPDQEEEREKASPLHSSGREKKPVSSATHMRGVGRPGGEAFLSRRLRADEYSATGS